ncbi:hypothetical protein DPMN_066918 [Dreissena polymorpha]|uniref:Uncharacterized protein n=1 Tax=Dreissena polymorpha TaxID=45954 RepID=A0A9D4BSF4_DREPO|nr:hypothetical protein DPMN_066918 [Dreissena polymorpha]
MYQINLKDMLSFSLCFVTTSVYCTVTKPEITTQESHLIEITRKPNERTGKPNDIMVMPNGTFRQKSNKIGNPNDTTGQSLSEEARYTRRRSRLASRWGLDVDVSVY